MSHTANFKLITVSRDLTTQSNVKFASFTFEDDETGSEIDIDVWKDRNEIKNINADIKNYGRFNSGLDQAIEDVIKKVQQLEGII